VAPRTDVGPTRSVRQGPTTTLPARPKPLRKPLPAKLSGIFSRAQADASAPGREVLETARTMMQDRVLVVGSCWDYANAVFKRAGHPNKTGRRKTIFKGSRTKRQFADVRLIRPGDWLYYVNHQYRNVPHSAIFVAWLDRRRKHALMITYRGAKRAVPGQLDDYDLSSVYRIVRPISR